MDRVVGNGADNLKIRNVVSTIKKKADLAILQSTNSWTNLCDGLCVEGTIKNGISSKLLVNSAYSIDEAVKDLLSDWSNRNGGRATLRELCRILREEKYVSYAEALENEYGGECSGGSNHNYFNGNDSRGAIDEQEMNKRETFIKRNLPALLDKTTLNVQTLSYLVAEEIISETDLDEFNSIPNVRERKMAFYRLIITRKNWYTSLVKAMRKTTQTGVVDILMKADED